MRNIILMICILVSLFQTNAQDFISCNECERTVGDSSAVQEVLEEQIPLVEAVANPIDNPVTEDNSCLAVTENGEHHLTLLPPRSTMAFNNDSSKVLQRAYEPHHGMDFRFFKIVTNPNTKPYKFFDDQTWTGIPVLRSGMIAKA